MTTEALPRLRLELPTGFTGLPIEESTEDNEWRLRGLAERIAAPAAADTAFEQLTTLTAVMVTNQIHLFGRFAVATADTEQPALASLALAMTTLARGTVAGATIARNRKAAAAALRKQHQERLPHAKVGLVELPIGPAMIAVTAGEYRLPPELTGRPHPVVRPELKAEFQIPAPDGSQLIGLTVTTGSTAAWPAVAAAAMRVATSLSFDPPEE